MRSIRILKIATSAILLSTAAMAQAPPTTKPPIAPKAEQFDPNACAQTDTPSTGEGRGS
jgi:hypothetical protein